MTTSESDDFLLADLIDLPTAEREAYLLRTCGNDFAMRQRLVAKLEQLMNSLSSQGSASEPPARSSAFEIAHALASGLEVQEKPGTTVGRYKLVRKIGEGGCGIVYLAEQQQPVQRQVALKLIKLGLDTREFVARFEAERQALALMDHPNIARVFDAGATDVGRPYFVMELVLGVPITRYCDEANLPVRDRLRLFVSVCQAVQHAHQKGVIHRDLKPSNILVVLHDGVPVPKIIDFGIAKAMGVRLAEQTLLTQFHSFIGTPAYASPEQIEMSGVDVDTRTDVYSLGVLLYELLTGRTPFDNDVLIRTGLDAMRKTIRETDPPRPSTRLGTTEEIELAKIATHRGHEPTKLIHHLRGDLDWIVMRCLEKDRNRRYETANGLAADLNRHLNDEPVMARPPSSAYRLQKLVRRNKLTFITGAAVAAALLLGIVVSTWQAVRATQAEHSARAAQASAAKQELIARQHAYASDMNVAWQALQRNDLGRALDLLDRQRPQSGESDLRGWEWRYLWQQTRSSAVPIVSGKTVIESLAVSPDGRWLAIGMLHRDGLFVWDLQTRQEVAHLAPGKSGVRAVFSPTEPLLAYATEDPTDRDNRLCFWNAETYQSVAAIPLEGACPGLAFSRDGKTLVTATGAKPGHLTVWRVNDGKPLMSIPCDLQPGNFPATRFAAASDLSVVAYGENGRLHIVDLRSGLERPEFAEKIHHEPYALAFSPDGKTLASADGEIVLWDVASGKEIGRMTGHTDFVTSLVFWPDGSRLASSSKDHTIRTWDVASRRCSDVLLGHRLEVWRLVLLPDNRTLISASKEGTVCLWDTSVSHLRQEYVAWPERLYGWCFSEDGKSLLTLDTDAPREVVRRSGPDFQQKEVLLKVGGTGVDERDCFSKDGHFLACRIGQGEISVWDVPRKILLRTFKPTGKNNTVSPLQFLDDGRKLLLFVKDENRMLVWDIVAGREIQSWPAPPPKMLGCGVSPDGRRVVLANSNGEVSVRNLAEKSTTAPNLDVVEAGRVTFSPSGKLLAMAILMGYVRVWDAESWREVATLRGFRSMVCTVEFSPDGHQLATTGSVKEEALKLWTVDGWEDVLTLQADGVGGALINVAFSPDGNTVGGGSMGGQLHVWRAPSWEEIAAAETKDRKSPAP